MESTSLALEGVKLFSPRVFADDRGFFRETYRHNVYREHGISENFVQDNHSFSKYGTIRGMHFQRRPGQAKLVSVIHGEIYDVVVDIRPDSPTFGKWEGVYLDGKKGQQLFVPVGFAHGFNVISEEAHVVYKVSNYYDPQEEKGFRFDDPDVNIIWPIKESVVSSRDLQSPFLKEVVFL